MSITINGNGTITGYTPTTISGTLSGSNMPSGSIIQTVIGASEPNTNQGSVTISSQTATAPTFFNSVCNVSLTPQFSDSKIFITFTASIRLDPDAEGYVGIYYSPNSDMSSPVILDPVRGGSRNEAFRNNDGSGDAHIFWCISQSSWDKTVSNTNTRYYSVGGYRGNNDNIYYGDQGVGLTMMAQEIKA
tara:strand:+ start:127 stop:693 length:567 start_codon:yes stop_codon:yes gene_type:complete